MEATINLLVNLVILLVIASFAVGIVKSGADILLGLIKLAVAGYVIFVGYNYLTTGVLDLTLVETLSANITNAVNSGELPATIENTINSL